MSERRFFERCAEHSSLAKNIKAYIQAVNPKRWPKDPFSGAGYWTSIVTPAGSLAIVPLALRAPEHLPDLVEHLRGVDLDHETFQSSLTIELVKRHGWTNAMLDFVAFRAVDGAGQNGCGDLRWLSRHGALDDLLTTDAEIQSFAERVDRVSQRKKERYRSLYVASAGKALFSDSEQQFARWLAFFAGRGLEFSDQERTLDPVHESKTADFDEVWDEAASCTDRD